MLRVCLMCLGAIAGSFGGVAAEAQSLQETLNLVLLGSAKDSMGLVEIQNASDCVVKLSNPENTHFAVLKLNNVDPDTFTVAGSRGDQFVSFAGPDVIAELHALGSGLAGASRTVQISAKNPDKERRNFRRLYAEFCSGRRTSTSEAGS